MFGGAKSSKYDTNKTNPQKPGRYIGNYPFPAESRLVGHSQDDEFTLPLSSSSIGKFVNISNEEGQATFDQRALESHKSAENCRKIIKHVD